MDRHYCGCRNAVEDIVLSFVVHWEESKESSRNTLFRYGIKIIYSGQDIECYHKLLELSYSLDEFIVQRVSPQGNDWNMGIWHDSTHRRRYLQYYFRNRADSNLFRDNIANIVMLFKLSREI